IETVVPPFAPMYLGSVLFEAGHEVKIVDVFPTDTLDYCQVVEDFSPQVVGITVLTTNFLVIKNIIANLRSRMPKVKIVVGGIHPTVLPEESIFILDSDFAIVGEGENALAKLCENLENNSRSFSIPGVFYRDGDRLVEPPSRYAEVVDVDKLPMLNYDLVNMERYLGYPGYIRGILQNRIMVMICGRGCPGRCSFCNSHEIYGRKIRKRSIGLLREEIAFLIKRYKIRGIYFSDETLTIPKRWFVEACEMLQEFNLPWGCATRISLANSETLTMMRNAGCTQIDFGVESGSNKILRLMHKGHTAEMAKEVFANCEKLGIRTMGSFIIGNVGESFVDAMETVQILDEIKPNFSIFSFLTPFPGTGIYDFAIEKNLIHPKYYLNKTHDMFMEVKPVFNLSEMSNEDLMKIRALCQRKVFFRNYISCVNLQNIKIIALVGMLMIVSPIKILKSIYECLKSRSLDFLFFAVLGKLNEYERKKVIQ
ncbi:MAG: B12-binding domain-containing radical SAM protein, partial [Planctomycetes bacterium]|nr:B12-binding domain-containing radical SAM protein [Planctomycetota bacterium]